MRSRTNRLSLLLVTMALLAAVAAVTSPDRAAAQPQARCGSAAQAAGGAAGEAFGAIFQKIGGAVAGLFGSGTSGVGFEGPADIWGRCGDPYFDENGHPRRQPDGQGSSSGDPHIRTHDGVGFLFQGAGDYPLVIDPGADIEIQVRHTRFAQHQEMSTVRGVAVRIGDDVIGLNDVADAGTFVGDVVLINGEPMQFLPGGWHEASRWSILRAGNTIIITTDSGYALSYEDRVVIVDVPSHRAGAPVGLLGDADGDPTNDVRLRDGTPIRPNDHEVLYGPYLDGWLVSPAESLFTVPFDPATQGPERPGDWVTLDSLPEAAVREATAACAAAGIEAGFGLESCAYDVAITGDETWINPSARGSHGDGTGSAAGVNPVVVSTSVVHVDSGAESVEGTLDGIGTAHDIVIVGDPSQRRMIRVASPCHDLLAPAVAFVIGGRSSIDRPLVCDTVIPVPAGTVTLRIVARYATVSDYAFTIANVGSTDLGTLGDGDFTTAAVESGDEGTAILDFSPDDTVYVAVSGGDCGSTITVVDANDTALASRAACFDLGTVSLNGPAPFTMRVTSGAQNPLAVEIATTLVTAAPIVTGNLGTELVLDVATPGQVPSASIELRSGQRLYIHNLSDAVAGDIVLTTPSGAEVARGFSALDIAIVAITEDGPHTLQLQPRGDEVGEHRLVVHEIPDEIARDAPLGQLVSATVATPGHRAVLTIDTEPGDRIFVDAVDEPGIADMTLLDFEGSVVAEMLSFEETGPITITGDGPHRLVIDPRSATFGRYRFIIHAVPADPVVAAAVGDTVTVTTATPGQSAQIVFSADAGDEITIESVDSGPLGEVQLIAPSGAVIADALSFDSIGPVATTETGDYRLRIDPRSDAIGQWTWAIN